MHGQCRIDLSWVGLVPQAFAFSVVVDSGDGGSFHDRLLFENSCLTRSTQRMDEVRSKKANRYVKSVEQSRFTSDRANCCL